MEEEEIKSQAEAMDVGLRMMIQTLYKLDMDSCVPVTDLKRSIHYDGKDMELHQFLDTHSQIVTMDMFSTKEIAEQGPEVFKHLFVQFFTRWYIIRDEQIPVGYSSVNDIYNGFPNILDENDLIVNPQETMMSCIDELIRRKNPADMDVRPRNMRIMKVYFKEEFLDKLGYER